MNELEILMSDAASFIEQQLNLRHEAMQDLILLRARGQEPNIMRVLAPDTALLIRFQDVPK